MKRALEIFPDAWWAAEACREDLEEYWRRDDAEDLFGSSDAAYAHMDEDEADVYRAIHSPVDDPDDLAERQRKEKYTAFAKRADADKDLQACLTGTVYHKGTDEWIQEKTWSLTGTSHDPTTEKTYTDSKTLQNLESDFEWMTDSFIENDDCPTLIKCSREWSEAFTKMPVEQQTRLIAKMLWKAGEEQRQDLRAAWAKFEQSTEKPASVKEEPVVVTDDLPTSFDDPLPY